ncbi:nuclear transport factor 2 family protein [Nonomuraea sp. ZG12]|uniref:nuclear transport factor 2 family protein n=1 Tax=Nonomuraea sp. ZG12 TaxID=3452207 RepID=UPI003F88F277
MKLAMGMATALLLAAGVGVSPQTPPTTVTAASTPASRTIDTLARDLERVESVREVKDLQRTYTHLSQFGQWNAMAALFADDGTLRWGDETATGRKAIKTWLKNDAGAMDGTRPGSLHTEIIDQPLVNLSVDGRTAKVRWDGMRFLGDGKGRARIEGGIYENEYVLKDRHWQIATLRYHPQYEGDYATGWTNVGGADLPIVPPHFTLDETGVPNPEPSGPAPRTRASARELADRIGRLNDEDTVRNLQNAYGYYVDRKMWTDVVDLFSADARFRIDGVGVYRGRDGVRRAMERMGPEGLTHGQLNDHPIFDLIVDVRPGGREAITRGIQIGMLGDADTKKGAWEFATFRNRFVKQGELWKLTEVHVQPLLSADYAEGWGNGGTTSRADRAVPEFLKTPARQAVTAARTHDAPSQNLTDLKRRLDRSHAYDGAENVSSAYGFTIDDFQWPWMAGIFAVNGNKQSPFAGYYFGRDRILGAVNASWGGPLPPDALRARISFHWLTQPVIMVSQDGRSATLRTRLFQPRTSKDGAPGFSGLHGGMYHNQAVLENGIWRLWTVTIDEHYYTSPTWAGGWASAEDPPPDAPKPPDSPLLTRYPPDIKLTELGEREEGFRGGTGTTITWPGILPMWFHYRNPVSGRTPERYWPDCVPCELRPETRMTAHGYQMPPTGPSVDGVDVNAN